MSNPTEVKTRMAWAQKWARQAGEVMIKARLSDQKEEAIQWAYKGEQQELVTNVDQQIDKMLCDAIKAAFPEDQIVSEESFPQRSDSALAHDMWVIDPIDGTVNFAHGLPHVAVSIAWYRQGRPYIGVVYAPFLDEMFAAELGDGATLNGKSIQVSHHETLATALIGTGFPYERDQRQALMPTLTQVLTHCQDIRRCGSAALDLCHVACGRLDGYYETVSLWDFAAGILIAEEAGAEASHFYPVTGERYLTGEHWLVATPEIHQALQDLVTLTRS